MSVDRSYSEFETIRNYQDRGMMKWGAFATGELTDAQKHEIELSKQLPTKYNMTKDEILQVLVFSWTNHITVTVHISRNEKVVSFVGEVVEMVDKKSFRLNTGLKIELLNFDDLVSIN